MSIMETLDHEMYTLRVEGVNKHVLIEVYDIHKLNKTKYSKYVLVIWFRPAKIGSIIWYMSKQEN